MPRASETSAAGKPGRSGKETARLRHPNVFRGPDTVSGGRRGAGIDGGAGHWGLIDVLAVLRTAPEDRTQQRELAGCRDSTAVTRWRLLPGLW
jgi:hypothetical protein